VRRLDRTPVLTRPRAVGVGLDEIDEGRLPTGRVEYRDRAAVGIAGQRDMAVGLLDIGQRFHCGRKPPAHGIRQLAALAQSVDADRLTQILAQHVVPAMTQPSAV